MVYTTPSQGEYGSPFIITVAFDQDVDPTTLIPANLTLYDQSASAGVFADVTVETTADGGFGAAVFPYAPLTGGHEYLLTVENVASESTSIAMTIPYTTTFFALAPQWQFYTQDGGYPSVGTNQPSVLWTPSGVVIDSSVTSVS